MTNSTIATLSAFPNLNLVAWTHGAKTSGFPVPIAEQEALFRNLLCGEDIVVASRNVS